MVKKQVTWILVAIVVVAAFMRLWALKEGDPMGDEVLYAFRAIGMLDFDEANEQTTPLEWYDPFVQSSNRVPESYAIGTGIPWWASLSFHDHPPLVFFVQHLFMRVFGESLFVFRLPSALLGIASVYVLFLIGTILFSERVGLLAAAILAVNTHHLFISRLGLQEAYVVFFLLFASYLFLRSLERDTYFIWTGIALGFGFLTKYTTFVLVPIFLIYLFLFKRDAFFNKKFWFGALLAFILFSPMIVYNIKLYQAVGHFDFQFSYIFGQNPDVWRVAPGKEIGTLSARIKEFVPAFFHADSLVFGVFALVSLLFLRNVFLWLFIGFLTLFIVGFVGPSPRFLAMLIPFFALATAAFSDLIYRILNNGILKGEGVAFFFFCRAPCEHERSEWNGDKEKRKIPPRALFRYSKYRTYLFAGFTLFLFLEIAYSANSLLFPYPKWPKQWAFSSLRYENFRWGYNELNAYLEKELEGKMPALHFDMQYQFLNELHEEAIKKEKQQKLKPYPALILYDGNIDSIPQLWMLDRLNLYHAWPVIKIETFKSITREKGEDYFKRIGFEHYYVIIPTEHVPWKDDKYLTPYGSELEAQLIARGIKPLIIINQRGEEAFRIYVFDV